MPFEIVRNDITRMETDAIVNAANSSLLGGGGVDGAIHRAAGPELLEECRGLGGCLTGQAKITKGYNLPCKYVIHTVGPVWKGGRNGEKDLLVSCYRESLRLAREHECESVAFPLISSGAYGYPKDQALKAATDTIRDFLLRDDSDMTVYLVIFDPGSFAISSKLYANIRAFIDDGYMGPDYEERELRRRRYNEPMPLSAFRAEDAWEQFDEYAADSVQYSGAAPYPAKKHPMGSAKKIKAFESISEKELEKYLKQKDEGFREMLLRKIDESGMTDAQCYKLANVDRKLFSKIKNNLDYKPGKTIVVAFALALRLPEREIREMVEKAGYSLTNSSKFDMIVEYHIRHGVYDIFRINEALFTFDQKLLGSGM